MECQYVATQRGGVALVFEGHRYNKVRDGKDGTVYWRCSRDRQCPGRAVTVNNRVKKANNKHNHPPEASLRNGTNLSSSTLSSRNQIASSSISTPNSASRHSTSPNIAPSITQHLDSLRLNAVRDAFDAQNANAASAAAASLPAFVTETLKYLAAASNNYQMAALASTMATFSPSLKNIERTVGLSLLPSGGNNYYYSDYSEDQPLDMAVKNTGQLIKKLRDLMKNTAYVSDAIQAYIIPSYDSHQNEYLANSDKRLSYFTGFTGSYGTAVVTVDDAAVWTDARYFLQAEKELDHNWKLMKQDLTGTLSVGDWLSKVLPAGSRVGVDPSLISFNSWKTLSSQLETTVNQLVPISENLIDLIWDDKPAPPSNPIVVLPTKYTGQTWEDKVFDVRQEMAKKQAGALVLSHLDEIAWLFNIRGSDITYNPVFFAYAVITLDNIYLFVDETKFTPESLKHLRLDTSLNHNTDLSIELRPYKLILDFLKWFVSQQPGKIWISNKSSYSLVSLIPESRRLSIPNPVLIKKSIKNSVEIEGMRRAHIKDAISLCELYAWLEEEICKHEVTETMVVEKLEEFRRSQEDYIGPSFPTISSSGPNAAIIHYRPEEKTARRLTPDEIFLCDSGAQYKHGTTDVTRTYHFGTPSDYEKECYTRVFKGHVALASLVFPAGTKGQTIDSFARKHLWDVGLDYRHRTGHGVGMFLNVHEGPVYIGPRSEPDQPGLDEGMILSNEPGYYEDGKFGVRIESLVLVQKANTKYNEKGYLKFETITLVPIQTKLLNPSLLTEEEIEWLDNYHQTCREVVGKALKEQGRTQGYHWLLKETQSLG